MVSPERKTVTAMVNGLYVIIDAQAAQGRGLVDISRAALQGGARVLQLRDKVSDKGDVLPIARAIRDLCEEHDALLIINDHADLAVACNAHGLHLGQHDLPIEDARAILGPHQIIGTSNALLEEAQDSEGRGADYLAVGAMFPTDTKERTRPAGLETLRMVRDKTSLPLVAIGGIKEGNVAGVMAAGADAACVISAVVGDPDPEAAARRLVAAMEAAR